MNNRQRIKIHNWELTIWQTKNRPKIFNPKILDCLYQRKNKHKNFVNKEKIMKKKERKKEKKTQEKLL